MRCTLHTSMPYEEIEQLFRKELERTHERSCVTLTDDDGTAVFTIDADDTPSLRATMNGITSILGVYEHGRTTIAENRRA